MIAAPVTSLDGDIERINLRLGELLDAAPADLRLGAARAQTDSFIFCGILGGKDVGKSTLINSLARREISTDLDEVGEGTARAIAYVHRDAQTAVASRVEGLTALADMQTILHEADAIRHVVLIDLPDFDSEFRHHLEKVRTIAPLLDRVVWVVTPRKVGDRDWVMLFRRVFKDPTNVWCVLNKLDELLTDAQPFDADAADPARAFLDDQHEWLADTIGRAGLASDIDRRFVIAAGFPTRDAFLRRLDWLWGGGGLRDYPADRATVEQIARLASDEFDRLRAAIMGPVPVERIASLKLDNERRERSAACDLIIEHYDLDYLGNLCTAFDSGAQAARIREAFDDAFLDGAVAKVQNQLDADARCVDLVLKQRLGELPFLPWVHAWLGWIPGWLGRRTARPAPAAGPPAGFQTIGGIDLRSRVDLLRTRFASDSQVLLARLGLRDADLPDTDELTAALRLRLDNLSDTLGQTSLERIRGRDRKPSRLLIMAIWVIALWFPIVQPVAEGALQALSAGSLAGWTGGLYHVVAALSAVRLLSGLMVVGIAFLVLLTLMTVRATADVRKLLDSEAWREEAADAVSDTVERNVFDALFRPCREKVEELRHLLTCVQACRAA